MAEEIIMWRGEKIPVGWYKEQYQAFKKADGTPYFTVEELEKQVQRRVLDRKRNIGRITGARFEKHSGFRLAFYEKEHKVFSEAYSIHVIDESAVKIVRKLLRHFGKGNLAKEVKVRFWGTGDGGSNGFGLWFSHNPSIGLICHEVAHYFEEHHNKKLMRWMKKLTNYCKRKNYWMDKQ